MKFFTYIQNKKIEWFTQHQIFSLKKFDVLKMGSPSTKFFEKKNSAGFILLFSLVLTAIILSLTVGLANVAYRQRLLTVEVNDSTKASYATDAAIECLVAQDLRGSFGDTSSSLPATITVTCDGLTDQTASLVGNQYQFTYVPSPGTSNSLDVGGYCAHATITKYLVDPDPLVQATATNGTIYDHDITVTGYNLPCSEFDAELYDAQINNTDSPVLSRLIERSLSYAYKTDEP